MVLAHCSRLARQPVLTAAAILLVATVAARQAYPYAAVQNKADNTEIRIVPAPGKVTVMENSTTGT